MSTQEFPSMRMHGPGVRAELSADRDDECLLEITQIEPAPGRWQLEVVWQPVDERGLARGFGCPLYQTPLTFSKLFGDQPQAYIRLPANISFELARKCYYRVVAQPSPLRDSPS